MRPRVPPQLARHAATVGVVTVTVLAGTGAPAPLAASDVATVVPTSAQVPPAELAVDTDRERTPGTADQHAARRAALAAASAASAAAAAAAARAASARASRARHRAPLAPRDVAKALLPRRGWGTSTQYRCLNSLWTKESNWRVNADNRSSSAYGIPQALPGAKMSRAGADWRTNPATQISWGLGYIASRYGSPCAAWSHSRAYNWY